MDKQTEILEVETIGGHERWSLDEGTGFLSMPRWSPWEVEMRYGHKQTEISVVETIGGHGRWSPDEGIEFLSMPRWRP
jgi:hypothetical protein